MLGCLAQAEQFYRQDIFNIHPNLSDMVLMVLVAAVTMVFIYYLDYATFVLQDGRRASAFIGFFDFVDTVFTSRTYV